MIEKPRQIMVTHFAAHMQIIRKWTSIENTVLTVGFVTLLAAAHYYEFLDVFSMPKDDPTFWLLVVFECFIGYALLAGWLNKTTIIVTKNSIKVDHGVLPWWGNGNFEFEKIIVIWVEMRGSKSARRQPALPRYLVKYLEEDGSLISFLGGLDSKPHGEYIAQAMRDYLGVKSKI